MRLIHRFLIAAALILSGLSAFAVEPIAVQRWSYKPRLEKPAAEGFRFALSAADLPAGTEVDFGMAIGIENGAPVKWVCEYRFGGESGRIGNSFTFFGSSYLALMEIARSQGHSLQIGVNTKGGQNFGQHLNLERSRIASETVLSR